MKKTILLFILTCTFLLYPQLASAQSGSVVWNYPSIANAPSNIQHNSFFSSSMQTEVGYTVYLPPGYNSGNQSYPVIYFLHGINGNEWNYHSSTSGNASSLPSLIDAGKIPPTIVIFPNGGKGLNYVDKAGSCAQTKSCPETMLITELIPDVDSKFRTFANREGRALEGFSMGGIGSSYLGTKYPNLFSSVASLSSGCWLIENCSLVQTEINQNVIAIGSTKPAMKLSYGSETNKIVTWQNDLQGLLINQGFQVEDITVLLGIGHDLGAQLSNPVSSNTTFGLSLGLFHWNNFGTTPNPTSTPTPTPSVTPTPTPSGTPTPSVTPTPTPSSTPVPTPTVTPTPSATPNPTRTPRPSNTPLPPRNRNGASISVEEQILSDIDKNNIIDLNDFQLFRQVFSSTNCEKNIVGDCVIDIFDYNILYEAYLTQK